MKICPKCRHICQDTDKWCPRCNYNMAGIKTLSEQDAPVKKKNRNIVIVLVIIAIFAALLLFAMFYPSNSNWQNLPGWMQDRMQYQKTGVSVFTPDNYAGQPAVSDASRSWL